MERLTDYSDSECTYIIGVGNKTCEEFCKYVVDGCKNCYIQQVFKKLADYEDLEEQGLLVRLPCKVGDIVYVILSTYCKSKYAEAQVRDYAYFISCGFCVVVTSTQFEKQSIPFSEFGKTVFLTREEAEKKLEEMKKND